MFDLSKPYCFYFNEISKIPHGSFNEEALSKWLVAFAEERGLKYVRDEHNNVVIYKDGSEGYENSDPIILQGHMDMVCEANKDTVFDFEKDPLVLRTEGDWLMATGTTLGADDGAAVAYMLAILDDDTIPHPPLECCFTVQEEVGLLGALKLDKNLFKAKRMICLDHEGEYDTCASTSGGSKIITHIKGDFIDNENPTYDLFVKGLKGGHSGTLINDCRANANKLAFRMIRALLAKDISVNIVNIDGGSKENAIPRECEVIFTSACPKEKIIEAFETARKGIYEEFHASEKAIDISLTEIDKADKCFDEKTSKNMINFIFLCPNGFKEKSPLIEGLTVTSLNLGVIKTNGDDVAVTHSIRSVYDSARAELIQELETLASMCGATIEYDYDFPGWDFAETSDLRDKLAVALKKVSGKDLVCSAVHGGNECGIFSSLGVKDIISYGPIMEDIHTPQEKLDLNSFDRCYEIVLEILKNCK